MADVLGLRTEEYTEQRAKRGSREIGKLQFVDLIRPEEIPRFRMKNDNARVIPQRGSMLGPYDEVDVLDR